MTVDAFLIEFKQRAHKALRKADRWKFAHFKVHPGIQLGDKWYAHKRGETLRIVVIAEHTKKPGFVRKVCWTTQPASVSGEDIDGDMANIIKDLDESIIGKRPGEA